ncbi:related to 1-aminocyclopropane-1-carboxylate synthase, and related proteins [Ramularia collo-cygni]|uniref:Related to 1-aminocyclopropane-1-carboxylate synthase, and related proteins n=1 Tax=Ramularia collo-cygni TaxID=112498 RepID=A0A2D3UWD2_9PEZI|nr:related to 1-aminocyclopropane-1-carboxylate synthase, and related proteins [Ramularia collo-cygni]CZT16517.1 related to 1-aminocyclopropane-1-carboxylate synthase, and related proteins [Ramularia collo-cygni]
MASHNSWLSRRVHPQVQRALPAISASLASRDSEDVIDLNIAENRLMHSAVLSLSKAVIAEQLGSEALSYPRGFGGQPELLSAFASFFNTYFNPDVAVEPYHVVAGPGATACLVNLLCSICDHGTAVIVPGPYWNGFDVHLTLLPGVHLVSLDPDLGGKDAMDTGLDDLLDQSLRASELWGKEVRAVLITNPHNPSGRCYSVEALAMAARFCEKHALHLIVDEIYAMSPVHQSSPGQDGFTSILALDMRALGVDPARVHVVWSTSKDFGCSGYRVGAVVSQANPAVRASLGLLNTTQISSLAANVTAGMLSSPQLPCLMAQGTRKLRQSYSQITAWLEAHNFTYVPVTGGICILARLAPHAQSWEDEAAIVQKIKAAGVVVGAGRTYHLREHEKGWCRLVFAVPSSVLKAALCRMEVAMGLTSLE